MSESPARVLVIDDHEQNRHLLRRLLEKSGHDVDVAENGRVALDKLAAETFDLVLLDIMMPVMNGHETLAAIKSDDRLRDLPVIVISALDETAGIVRCIEAGAEDYVAKPFDNTLLRARISACLEKKRLRDHERRYLDALRGELRLGRQIQADFLPRELPQPEGWEISAHFQPAHEVAGDFYDAFSLYGGRVGLVIADVCDKGVGAALFMALVRTLVRVFAELARPDGTEPPNSLPRPTLGALTSIRRTNDYLLAHHKRTNMFASLFFGILDPERASLVYVNAGHEPPLHFGRNGLEGRLTRTGPALGLVPGATYTWQEVVVESEDVILAYTDGITEARSPTGELYTERRFIDFVRAVYRTGLGSAAELVHRVEGEIAQHVGAAEPSDDVTLFALRRMKAGKL